MGGGVQTSILTYSEFEDLSIKRAFSIDVELGGVCDIHVGGFFIH